MEKDLETADFIGNKQIIDFLNNRRVEQKLNHGYIFIGEESVGKTTAAKQLFAKLLEIPVNKLEIHPDFTLIEREINEKTGKLREQISISQIQTLREKLSKTAIHGGYKTVIIRNAHQMSTKAANAFLKTLEEPTKNTVIILTTTSKDAILETLQSRTQHFEFKTTQESAIKQALEARKPPLGEQDIAYITQAAAGKPGIAISLSNDKEKLDDHKKETELVQKCLHKSQPHRLLALKNLIPEYKEDHVATRNILQERIDKLEILTRNKLLETIKASQTETRPNTDISGHQAQQMLKGIGELRSELSAHINPKIALIKLAISII